MMAESAMVTLVGDFRERIPQSADLGGGADRFFFAANALHLVVALAQEVFRIERRGAGKKLV